MSAPGQSGDPDSEFYDNLVDPFIEGEYFPLLYTRSAIQQNTAKRVNLVPNQNP
jgi:penicillin G amidase